MGPRAYWAKMQAEPFVPDGPYQTRSLSAGRAVKRACSGAHLELNSLHLPPSAQLQASSMTVQGQGCLAVHESDNRACCMLHVAHQQPRRWPLQCHMRTDLPVHPNPQLHINVVVVPAATTCVRRHDGRWRMQRHRKGPSAMCLERRQYETISMRPPPRAVLPDGKARGAAHSPQPCKLPAVCHAGM